MADISVKGLHGVFDKVSLQGDSSIVGAYDNTKNYGTELHGAPVKLTGDKTVGLAADGDQIFGVIVKIEHDGVVSVGKGGVHACRFAEGAAPAAGDAIVAGPGNTVKTGAGIGVVIGVEDDNGIEYAYVDLSRGAAAAVTP